MTSDRETVEQWFLSRDERTNRASRLPAWTEGNDARPLIHGSSYFARLVEEVSALAAGDHLFLREWGGDAVEAFFYL